VGEEVVSLSALPGDFQGPAVLLNTLIKQPYLRQVREGAVIPRQVQQPRFDPDSRIRVELHPFPVRIPDHAQKGLKQGFHIDPLLTGDCHSANVDSCNNNYK
jgi:hypothetical protein